MLVMLWDLRWTHLSGCRLRALPSCPGMWVNANTLYLGVCFLSAYIAVPEYVPPRPGNGMALSGSWFTGRVSRRRGLVQDPERGGQNGAICRSNRWHGMETSVGNLSSDPSKFLSTLFVGKVFWHNKWTFTIPATTPPGNYLLRFEQIYPLPANSLYVFVELIEAIRS